MPFAVRVFSPGDLTAVRNIWAEGLLENARDEKLGYPSTLRAEEEEFVRSTLSQGDMVDLNGAYQKNDDRTQFWVAVKSPSISDDGSESEEGEVVGGVGLRVGKSIGEADIGRLCVTREYRGSKCGVAAMLMDALESHAWDKGFRRITATTSALNLAACKMYEKRYYDELFRGRKDGKIGEPPFVQKVLDNKGFKSFKRIISTAPARICLFGDHQDYLSLPVIACAVDRTIKIDAVPNEENVLSVHKLDLQERDTIAFDAFGGTTTNNTNTSNSSKNSETHAQTPDFLRLALRVLCRAPLWCEPTNGFDVTISGDIPINAGMSSSSAMIVAWINFLVAAYGVCDVDPLFNADQENQKEQEEEFCVTTVTASGDVDSCKDKATETRDKRKTRETREIKEKKGMRKVYQIAPSVLAKIAWLVEVVELGFSGGKMDHYSISFGSCIYLDTAEDVVQTFDITMCPPVCTDIDIDTESTSVSWSLVVAESGVREYVGVMLYVQTNILLYRYTVAVIFHI